ncbi:MAG: hypothetical protein L0Z62_09780 [Gemmataceae bacterium]|nr:hypothetical protein [Gemmataceae bacterium]
MSSPSGSGSTRQLLDELDALMQRMMELPVNQLEDDPVPPTNTVIVPPAPAPANEPEPPASPPRPAAPSGTDLVPARQVIAHGPSPYPAQPHRREEVLAESQPAHAALVLASPRSAAPAPLPQPTAAPRVALPAVTAPPEERSWRERLWGRVMPGLQWSNRTFERLTAWLGNPGRWLRSATGRATLGWIGLALWALALTLGLLRLLG